MSTSGVTASDLNAILPQTQCGLCGFKGCKPYAEALTKGEAEINLCPPGGIEGLHALGQLLHIDPTPYLSEMEKAAKPRLRAVIREQDCIGCTKCIKACPVDAILGSTKQMHTVIQSECTGCELCVSPCPVDCIDIIAIADHQPFTIDESQHFQMRYEAREKRLAEQTKKTHSLKDKSKTDTDHVSYIQAALLRAKQNKT